MSSEFRLPDLGENVTGGEVVRVLVAEGQTVEKNQTVIELETDKALLEVPSPVAGRVTKIYVAAGKKLKIHDLIATIEDGAGVVAAAASSAPAGIAAGGSDAAPAAKAPAPGATAPQARDSAAAPKAVPPKPALAAPTVAPETPAASNAASLKSAMDQEGESQAPGGEAEVAAEKARLAAEADSGADADADGLGAREARVVEVGSATHVVAAPSTRRLARQLGVELADVRGSGGGGRITEEDVREHIRQRMAAKPSARGTAPEAAGGGAAGAVGDGGPRPWHVGGRPVAPPLPDFSQYGVIERKPLSNVRKRTMEQLSLAWSLIPHVTQVDEADVTDLESLRQRHAKHAEAKGGKLTSTVFVLKAVVAALKQFPQFNATLDVDAEQLIVKRYYNVGIAVDTEHGLIVPVIREVDKKHLIDLSAELSLVSERTRARKITLDDLRGGTFTISNLGGIGGTSFTPIINHPEVAILGLSRYQKRLVMKNDRLETRLFLPLCLSYDHRIIDGADGVRFTRKIAEMLEDPALLLLE